MRDTNPTEIHAVTCTCYKRGDGGGGCRQHMRHGNIHLWKGINDQIVITQKMNLVFHFNQCSHINIIQQFSSISSSLEGESYICNMDSWFYFLLLIKYEREYSPLLFKKKKNFRQVKFIFSPSLTKNPTRQRSDQSMQRLGSIFIGEFLKGHTIFHCELTLHVFIIFLSRYFWLAGLLLIIKWAHQRKWCAPLETPK